MSEEVKFGLATVYHQSKLIDKKRVRISDPLKSFKALTVKTNVTPVKEIVKESQQELRDIANQNKRITSKERYRVNQMEKRKKLRSKPRL
ncbi:hypothetical protein GEMRC1_002967 [Eukaryota sp. GEM-RC1]